MSAVLLAASAWGGEKHIRNDGFTGTGSVSSSVQFLNGQGAGVVLTPEASDYPLTLIGIDVLCVPTTPSSEGLPAAYVIDVFDEAGGMVVAPPMSSTGNVYSSGIQFTASSTKYNRVTLPSPRTITSGKIFVKLLTQFDSATDGTTIAMDSGPAVPKANYFYDFGVPGEIKAGGSGNYGADKNWIVRAVLKVPDVPPTVTSITPNTGQFGVAQEVVIEGTSFEFGTLAFLGNTQLVVTSRMPPTQLVAQVPATLAIGQHDVIVKNGMVSGVLPKGYTVVGNVMDGGEPVPDAGTEPVADAGTGEQDAGVPGRDELTLESIDPADAFAGEDTELLLLGTNFDEGVQVLINKKLVEPIDRKSGSVIGATLLQNTLPAGVYDVTVINSDGARATLSQALTVHDGTSVQTGCQCSEVPVGAAIGWLALAFALRRRSRTK